MPIAFALLAAAVQTATPPPPAVPPPPGERRLIAWMPGPVICDGTAATPIVARRPLGTLVYGATVPDDVTLTFAIAADGRTGGIRQIARTGYAADVPAALAATMFAGGSPRSNCTITYRAAARTMAEAAVDDLISYTLQPLSGNLPDAGWARVDASGDCDRRRRPNPRRAIFPEFNAIPATPGVRDWTIVAFDVDDDGRPRNARHRAGTGNSALDRAGVAALDQSRFAAGSPRRGCLIPYWRDAGRIPAPASTPSPDAGVPMPDPAARTGVCATDATFVRAPQPAYPTAFQRRAIEGWAQVAFDVAPWGAVGNARVLRAEPAEVFGEAAMAAVRSATFASSPTGGTGCVRTIRFAMPPQDAAPLAPADEAG